ncbi:O-methyltransferase [Lewinella sp. JB7]|uniref:O-methyltransferase n=1 Tax=Lewinella sp. JB7 TaxID=2962887 RepID=UPI0020C9D97C|nr:O-methyltransferase [Lewinella sp. JB7]MCP9237883.1 O-methyltransferase [Lewinella sp. JB7]
MRGKPTRRDRIDPQAEYAGAMSGPVPDYLHTVERQTHLRTLAPQMITGTLQGRFLAMLSAIHRPHRVLELGTFTGYGTLCLAEGLAAGGTIDTIEGDPEMAWLARRHFAQSPYAKMVTLHEGQIESQLQNLTGPYDLIFLDADKQSYPDYFDVLAERLRPGGLLLADNVLWDGKVGRNAPDRDAAALREYNRRVRDDDRFTTVVLPLRDGLSVARKTLD